MNYYEYRFSRQAMDLDIPGHKTLAEHLRDDCEAKTPESCPLVKEANAEIGSEDVERRGSEESSTSSNGHTKDIPRDGLEAAIRPIYDRISKSGVVTNGDMDELNRIDDLVLAGKLLPARVPGSLMQEGATSGIPKWMRSMYHLLAATAPKMRPTSSYGIDEELRRQNDIMVEFAKANSRWEEGGLQNLVERTVGRESFIAAEGESQVYKYEDKVLKVNRPYILSDSVTDIIERYMLHNYYFPESRVELIGFGKFSNVYHNDIGILVSQDLFDLTDEEVPLEDRLDFMYDHGFVDINGEMGPEPGRDCVLDDENASVFVGDLHMDNIRRTKDGRIVVVDSLCQLNVPELERGGKYQYDEPPETMPEGEGKINE